MKITLQKIAEHAGTSISTVSNTLRNSGRVSTETKRRVIEIARELGYRGLSKIEARTTSSVVALLLSVDREWAFGWNFILPIIQELESAFAEFGKRLVLVPTRKHEKEIEIFEKICTIQPEAVAALHIGDSTLFVRLEWEDVPVVVVMNSEFQDAFYSVCVDDFHGAYEGTSYLLDMGHRRVAFVSCEREGLHVLRTDRLLGYQKAHQVKGIQIDEKLSLFVDPDNLEEIVVQLGELFALDRPPSALYCLDDELAIRVVQALERLQIAVPRDVSIIAPGDVLDHEAPTTRVPISTMRIDTRAMGRIAADMIMGRIERKSSTQHVVKINQHFVDRGSCIPPLR